MTQLRMAALLLVLSFSANACSYTATLPPSMEGVQAAQTAGPSDPSALASTDPASGTAAASDTPNPVAQSIPLPFANLVNVSQYLNPAGQPAQAWYGLPIMPQATAGQEFKPGEVYSFQAAATITQGVSYYKAKLPALHYSFNGEPDKGSTGSGASAMHTSVVNCNKDTQILVVYIASYDNDPGHIIVVLSTQ